MSNQEYLPLIRNRISELLGLFFPDERLKDMLRSLVVSARELNLNESVPFLFQWLTGSELSRNELNILASNLTVGETYFFREQTALDLFRLQIIPELLQNKNISRPLKIWSAGCSSGEEPYTLAMILLENFPWLTINDVSILATDISPGAIKKALQGSYTQWSFRTIDQKLIDKYFTKVDNHWNISPEIKRMVTFSYLNLATDPYPSSITNTENVDIIFCRNVLMYFSPQLIKSISNKFNNSLSENGWLITSQVELNDEYFSSFKRIQYDNGIFYKKCSTVDSPLPLKREITSLKSGISTGISIQKQKKQQEKPVHLKKTISPAISSIPASPENKNIDVKALFLSGQYQQIIDVVEKRKKQFENDISALPYIARVYANSGKYSDAKFYLDKLIQQNNITADLYYLYASVLVEQNDLENAELSLKKALYLQSGHIASHLMLGNIMNKQGKSLIASKYFKNAFTLLNQYPDDEIVEETDGLTAGRLKNMIINLI